MTSKQNEHPLHHRWVYWEHTKVNKPEDYANSMKDVCDFNTVEDFWKVWSYLPRPSEVLYDGTVRKEGLNRKIDAFSMFKNGIRPEWEDVMNNKASEFSTVGPFDHDVDLLWENLVLSLIGETIEGSDEICGCRVVDKYKQSKNNKSSTRAHYRFELWLRPGVTKEQANCVKERLLDALADGDSEARKNLPAFEYKTRS